MELKPLPVNVIEAPAKPFVGEKELMASVPSKLVVLVAVMPLTVTEIFPIVLPAGTVAVILVALLSVTFAVMPLNFTVLFSFTPLKPVPEIVMEASSGATPGVKVVIANGNTKNSLALVTVNPWRVTLTLPVVAPDGTVTVRLVGLVDVTGQTTPLILTAFSDGVTLNPLPVMVKDEFAEALGDEREIISKTENLRTRPLVTSVTYKLPPVGATSIPRTPINDPPEKP